MQETKAARDAMLAYSGYDDSMAASFSMSPNMLSSFPGQDVPHSWKDVATRLETEHGTERTPSSIARHFWRAMNNVPWDTPQLRHAACVTACVTQRRQQLFAQRSDEARAAREGRGVQACPLVHPLKVVRSVHWGNCDVCKAYVQPLEAVFACEECSWWACERCYT